MKSRFEDVEVGENVGDDGDEGVLEVEDRDDGVLGVSQPVENPQTRQVPTVPDRDSQVDDVGLVLLSVSQFGVVRGSSRRKRRVEVPSA